MFTRRLRLGAGLAAGLLSVAVLAGCGSGGSSSDNSAGNKTGGSTSGANSVDAALKKGGSITVWAWEPTLKKVVTGFEQKYPNVHVKLVNAGTGNDQYTALQNAIKAGSGIPDVAQIEYYALPQFALTKSLTDLSTYGAADLDSTFTPGPWNSVHSGNGIYGLPMDSGPMALFYNKKVFDQYGLAVPTTWDEYIADAQKLHSANPKAYITNDTGDAGFATSLIWQAGGKPFQTDGSNVTINLADQGTTTAATTWQKLISGHLLSPVSSWSDQWYQGMANGTIASLVIGAWMPANLESGVAAGKGDWRVAPMPQFDAGANATSENGGSSLAVPSASKNAALAYAFLKYADVDQGVQTRIDGGAFPATTADLTSSAFQDKTFPYFGGQQINKVLAQSAQDVVKGWTYLPYQVYANSIFNDTAGKAYTSDTTLAQGLKDWQSKLVSYGKDQGFSVTAGS